MPKYDVTLMKTRVYEATVTVTAADEEEAETKGEEKAYALKDAVWEEQSEEIEVQAVDEAE